MKLIHTWTRTDLKKKKNLDIRDIGMRWLSVKKKKKRSCYSVSFRKSLRHAVVSTFNSVESSIHTTSRKERVQAVALREWGASNQVAIILLAAVSPAKITCFLSLEILRDVRSFKTNTRRLTGAVSCVRSDHFDPTLLHSCPTGHSQNIWINVARAFKEQTLQKGSPIIRMQWILTGVRYVLCKKCKWTCWWSGLCDASPHFIPVKIFCYIWAVSFPKPL